ncbi:MAG: glycosyltransferase family 4 protein [Muribaculaceae bacterium]|nr:glycosyltransferase family 4 protein [Muribaculaceae bacterium]
MKALFLSHILPFPEIGGDRLRIGQSLRLLSELYDVDVYSLTNDPSAAPMKEFLSSIREERRYFAPKLCRIVRALKSLINGKTLEENLYMDPRLMVDLKRIVGEYDLIYCASAVMAQYAMEAGARNVALDMTDSLSMNFRNAARNAKGLKRLLLKENARRMEKYERNCRKRIPSIAYISAIDRDYLGEAKASLSIVHNGVNGTDKRDGADGVAGVVGADARAVRPYNCGGLRDGERELVFVGKMDYEPNVTAVRFFAREVMPRLRERYPDVKFTIVGIRPKAEVIELGRLPGVEVTGFVESLAPYFERATAVVAPMLSGSGVQNKILEALGHGCYVLTTPIGFEGIESLGDVVDVIEPDAEAWVDVISGLFKNPAEAQKKAGKAAERVEEEFGIANVRAQFRRFLSFASEPGKARR